jgi:iron complex transport system permease protein
MKKTAIVFTMICLFILGIILSLTLGAVYIRPLHVFQAMLKPQAGINSNIVWNLRIPRTLLGVLAGSALAVSGSILQGILRNPLASPSILGISSGASVCAVLTLVFVPHLSQHLPILAFLGGIIAAAFVYMLSWKDGIAVPRMILAGIAVSSFFNAVVTILIAYNGEKAQEAALWLIGSISTAVWKDVSSIWCYVIIALLLAVVTSEKLNVLILGDDIANNLGLQVEAWKMFFISISVLLSTSVVSVVGTIGFVGLIIPNIIRQMGFNNYRQIIILSIIGGSSLILICDSVGRWLFNPIEIPVGAITAFLGAPFFLYILRKRV